MRQHSTIRQIWGRNLCQVDDRGILLWIGQQYAPSFGQQPTALACVRLNRRFRHAFHSFVQSLSDRATVHTSRRMIKQRCRIGEFQKA